MLDTHSSGSGGNILNSAGHADCSFAEVRSTELAMQRVAHTFEAFDETDELANDRLPGMPMLGFFAGTVLSLAIWGVVVLVAWSV
jgi:hypothetical protein